MNIPSGILVCGNRGVGKTTLLSSLATHFERKTTVKFIQTETMNLGKYPKVNNNILFVNNNRILFVYTINSKYKHVHRLHSTS